MAEINRARAGQFYRTLLEVLIEQPGGLTTQDAIEQVVSQVELTDYEREVLRSGVPRYVKLLHFASTSLAKAGWIDKPERGQWVINPEGQQAYSTYVDPKRLYRECDRRRIYFAGGDAAMPALTKSGDESAAVEEDQQSDAEFTVAFAKEQAWAEITEHLRSMPPSEFETLVGDLLKAMGYHVAWKASGGKDGGIDLIAYTDPLGTRTPRIKVQVKRYKDNVSVELLRSFMALLGHDDLGLFVTTSGFTKDSKDEARAQQTRKVTLIDLERFFDLWVEHYPKLDDAARRRFPLQPIYFLAPAN